MLQNKLWNFFDLQVDGVITALILFSFGIVKHVTLLFHGALNLHFNKILLFF